MQSVTFLEFCLHLRFLLLDVEQTTVIYFGILSFCSDTALDFTTNTWIKVTFSTQMFHFLSVFIRFIKFHNNFLKTNNDKYKQNKKKKTCNDLEKIVVSKFNMTGHLLHRSSSISVLKRLFSSWSQFLKGPRTQSQNTGHRQRGPSLHSFFWLLKCGLIVVVESEVMRLWLFESTLNCSLNTVNISCLLWGIKMWNHVTSTPKNDQHLQQIKTSCF